MNDEYLLGTVLTVTCAKCTRQRSFGVPAGESVDATRARVAKAGWIMRGDKIVCPTCPQSSEEFARRFGTDSKPDHPITPITLPHRHAIDELPVSVVVERVESDPAQEEQERLHAESLVDA